MKPRSPFIPAASDLPASLAVFPLSGAVLMPGSELPLNIFEPRYLSMVQDALSGDRLVGMIQPRDNGKKPELHAVGCAGRISHYQETNDGRLLITLTGVSRYRIVEELASARGYRIVQPDWSEFSADYSDVEVSDALRQQLLSGLRQFLSRENLDVDWDALEKLSTEQLSNSLLAALGLRDSDKQMVIESPTVSTRIEVLSAVLAEAVSGGSNRLN